MVGRKFFPLTHYILWFIYSQDASCSGVMQCPFCQASRDKVIDSRGAEGGRVIRRRRECLGCKKRFTTYERVEETVRLMVIKKDGGRVPYERQKIAGTGEVPLPPLPWPVRPTNWMFRLLSILLLGIVLYSVSRAFSLPFVDADIAPVCIWLWLVGLLTLVLTSEPLPAGVGLLTLVSGFELFFDAMSPGLVGIGILAAIDLLMGLAISYLTTVRDLTGEVL